MASFRDALGALARGSLSSEILLDHIEQRLARQPELLAAILAELSGAYSSGIIEAETFVKLKAHARRAAGASEPAAAGGEEWRSTGAASQATSPRRSANADGEAKSHGSVASVDRGELDLDLTAVAAPAPSEAGRDAAAPGAASAAPQPLAPGSVLKERFVLDEVIGVGGMGTVYKGRDLLKVEAHDRNPHIAVKVLNEDFKKHPDAFIALQREASRQQKLAHPNIATVYDFDRSGETVFVTMEYMEGQPLNQYLRKVVRIREGLPFAEAFPIIQGLGYALSYAHERGIVHCDFKPANCFLTKSGTVKVFDFGIARVIKRQEDVEKTWFDPSKFGALTPAYASLEMLNNRDPDPRDDLYALACVAYELLSGRHPFDRKPANQARDRNMIPGPIKGVTRAQMRALTRALAFDCEQRTPSVGAFLRELRSRRPRSMALLVGAVAFLVALSATIIVLLR